MKSNSDNARFCRSCQVYKPPRAHHCSRSNRCILRMDHYCPWMNNCIGFYNYGHFIRFLIFVDIGCLFHFYLLTKRVLNPVSGMLDTVLCLSYTHPTDTPTWQYRDAHHRSQLYQLHICLARRWQFLSLSHLLHSNEYNNNWVMGEGQG